MIKVFLTVLMMVPNVFAAASAASENGAQLTKVSVEDKAGITYLHFDMNEAVSLGLNRNSLSSSHPRVGHEECFD